MEFKSYVDEGDKAFRRVAEDGRRIEEKTMSTELPDGSVQEVHEVHEEVIPMRLTKRVSIKKSFVPVEEKVETVAADGTINTNIKSLASMMEMPIINVSHRAAAPDTFSNTFSKMAAAKYENGEPVAPQFKMPIIMQVAVAAAVILAVVCYLTFV